MAEGKGMILKNNLITEENAKELYGAHRREIRGKLKNTLPDCHIDIIFPIDDIIISNAKLNTYTIVQEHRFFFTVNGGSYTSDELDKLFENAIKEFYYV